MDHLVAATTDEGRGLRAAGGDVQARSWRTARSWFAAVAKQVGGVVEYRTLGGRGGETFVRVRKDKQKEAVKFLLENAFTTPTKLLNPAHREPVQVLRRGRRHHGAAAAAAVAASYQRRGWPGCSTARCSSGDKAYTAGRTGGRPAGRASSRN